MGQESKTSIYRIDKFRVPAGARDDFLEAVIDTKRFLDAQPGCLQNLVLEQVSGPGRFNIVTVVEWADEAAFAGAGSAMMAWRKSTGFDAAALLSGLGVESDMVNYQAIETGNFSSAVAAEAV